MRERIVIFTLMLSSLASSCLERSEKNATTNPDNFEKKAKCAALAKPLKERLEREGSESFNTAYYSGSGIVERAHLEKVCYSETMNSCVGLILTTYRPYSRKTKGAQKSKIYWEYTALDLLTSEEIELTPARSVASEGANPKDLSDNYRRKDEFEAKVKCAQ